MLYARRTDLAHQTSLHFRLLQSTPSVTRHAYSHKQKAHQRHPSKEGGRPRRRGEDLAAAESSKLHVDGKAWSSVKIQRDSEGSTGERKYARRTRSKPLTGAFLDLPPELRNTIYRLALIADPAYIDLCPKSNQEVGNGAARYHHTRRFGKEIEPSLHLLRTCKQINAEAAPIFYGEQEWRFTSIKGWYVLDSFLRQIGPVNQALLRKIAVHVPSFNQATCVRRTKRILEEHGTLESLRLVLPDSYHLWGARNDELYDQLLDPSMFEGLRTTLLRLHGGMVGPNRDLQELRGIRRRVLASHVRARNTAVELGWEIEAEAYGELGNYPVELVEGDVIDEIPQTAD
ncbi:hypothetical protein LTR85_010917 [Meristemomyces frigidus]|nr:hypothetical protein LTR85_010917 [Meristemomyces frigidus]